MQIQQFLVTVLEISLVPCFLFGADVDSSRGYARGDEKTNLLRRVTRVLVREAIGTIAERATWNTVSLHSVCSRSRYALGLLPTRCALGTQRGTLTARFRRALKLHRNI